MKKVENSKLIKTILLLISTLPFPLFFAISLYVVPALYVCFVVPYLIWKIWFGKNTQKIRKITVIWKLLIMSLLACAMFFMEILLIFAVPAILPLFWKIIVFTSFLLIIRCITYAMMIFVWQSDMLTSFRKIVYTFILMYCSTISYFVYSSIDAPDTDDYSIPFQDYLK